MRIGTLAKLANGLGVDVTTLLERPRRKVTRGFCRRPNVDAVPAVNMKGRSTRGFRFSMDNNRSR